MPVRRPILFVVCWILVAGPAGCGKTSGEPEKSPGVKEAGSRGLPAETRRTAEGRPSARARPRGTAVAAREARPAASRPGEAAYAAGAAPRSRAPVGRAGAAPVGPPARKAPRDAFKATVKPPSYPVLYRLCRDRELRELKGWGLRKNPVGGTRFLAAVSGLEKKGNRIRFKLVLVEKKGEKWRLGWTLPLKTTEKSFYPAGGEGAASLFVDDYDWDGKPEALVRYRYPTEPERAVGWTDITDLVIVNVDGPGPRIAFSVNFNRSPQADAVPTVKSRLEHKDLNGDGHPDLVITRRSSDLVERKGEFVKKWTTDTLKYLWDRATDTYKPLAR